jgi:4-amino-4-deoxy-L-arabinose transferase-like glycosyltransferase
MSRDDVKTAALLSAVVLLITGFRCWFASVLDVAPDEAYYFGWSKALSLVYRDHPPMVAWAMRLGVVIFGETPLGVRFVAVMLSAAAIIGVYLIGIEMGLTQRNALQGATISTLLIAPASAAVICTPDTFLGAFYILAVLALLRLKRTGNHAWNYVFAIAAVGGLWSKWAALLMLPMMFAARPCKKTATPPRSTAHPVIAALLGLALVLPYIVAEAVAGFPAVSFQLAHLRGELPGATDTGPLIAAARIGEVVGGQAGLLSPLIAIFLVIYLVSVHSEESPLLKTAVLLPMAATCMAALFCHPEQNWAALGHPMAGPMVVFALHHSFQSRGLRLRVWSSAVLASVIAVFVIVHAHTLHPILPLPPERDPTSRLHGWSDLKSLDDRLQSIDAVVCDNYALAAEFSWQLRERIPANVTVTSPDRSPLPSPGDWLLLSQEGDFGRETLAVTCSKTVLLTSIPLKRPDGAVWDMVRVSMGRDCH